MRRASALTICLAVAVCMLLFQILLVSVFPETVDGSALVRSLVFPLMLLGPWALPVAMAWLFERLGPSRHTGRRIARICSGVALALAILFASFMVGMAGRLVMPVDEDAVVLSVLLTASLLLGLYGFRPEGVKAL